MNSDQNHHSVKHKTSSIVQFAWLPIPIFIVLIGILLLAGVQIVLEPPFLFPLLNFIFATAVSFFVAYLAVVSFARNASVTVLMLGSGMLFFGINSFILGIAVQIGHINVGVTVYNTSMLFGGICHLLAASALVMQYRVERHAILILSATYALVLTVTGLLTYMAASGLTPVFFIQGIGPTPLRQAVLGTAIGLHVLSGIIIAPYSRRFHWHFGRWYALSLWMIAIGLFGFLIISYIGSPLAWSGRAAIYVGGIYMLVAVLTAAREGGEWDAALQSALKESQERYRVLAEATFEGIFISEDGVIVDVNEQFCRMLHYSESGLIGKRIADLIPEKDREWVLSVMMTGQNRSGEHSMLKKDGSLIVVESHWRTILHSGREIRYSAVRDITDRKQSEKALRESEEKFRTVFEQAAVGMGRVSFDDYRWIEVNDTFCRMLGYSRGEILDTPWPQITHPEDVDLDLIPFKRMAKGELDSYTVEKRFIHKQGHHVWARLTLSLVRDPKGLPHYEIAVIENITDEKKAEEELLRINETLEHLVAERTRIAEARSRQLQSLAIELIETEERERRKFAHLLHDDLQQMLAAARLQLQALSDINPNALALVDVGLILDESIEKSRRLSHELSPPILYHSGLTGVLQWLCLRMGEQFDLKVELEVSTEPVIETPLKTFLFRSAQELLFNVVKHSGVNRARIVLSGSNSNVILTVIDDGKGIDPDTVKLKTGFGLMTIRERASYIGGSLSIDSTPGKGSRFELTVPLKATDDDSKYRQVLPEQPKSRTSQGIRQGITRVLLADDHHVIRQALVNLVNRQPGIEVLGEAANGQEAFELTLHLKPDVVVMDISMPLMDGIEATRRIKAELPDVRVIGLSMHMDDQLARAITDAGAETYMVKTASPKELLQAIYGPANVKTGFALK